MSEQGSQRSWAERVRGFSALQSRFPSEPHTPVPAMAQVWLSVHDGYPVYSLDEAPPPGMRLSNLLVSVSESRAADWELTLAAYRRVQDEMAEAYYRAQGSVQPD